MGRFPSHVVLLALFQSDSLIYPKKQTELSGERWSAVLLIVTDVPCSIWAFSTRGIVESVVSGAIPFSRHITCPPPSRCCNKLTVVACRGGTVCPTDPRPFHSRWSYFARNKQSLQSSDEVQNSTLLPVFPAKYSISHT